MKTIVGVDPASAKCVAVVLREDGYEICIHRTKAKDMPTRCLEAFRWMRKVVRDEDTEVVVYLERPVFARGGLKALLPLGEIQGALGAGAASAGALVIRVTPPEWKKAVIGNGSASKLKIKMYLKKTWPVFYSDSEGDIDVCDAGAIAIFGRKQATRGGRNASARARGGRRTGVAVSGVLGRGTRKAVAPLVKNSPRKLPTR